MKLKDKFAAILRRWASKLSPEKDNFNPSMKDSLYLPSPFGVSRYEVRRVAVAYRIPRREEMEAQEAKHYGIPDAYNRLCDEYKKRIVHSIVAAIWEHGLLDYTEKRDPDTDELQISGSLYVGIRDDHNNNTNPFKD